MRPLSFTSPNEVLSKEAAAAAKSLGELAAKAKSRRAKRIALEVLGGVALRGTR